MIYINSSRDNLPDLFNEVMEVGQVDQKYFRNNGLKVFLCKGAKTDIQLKYRNLATKEKAIYLATSKGSR